MITIYDIAKETGVSAPTVSKALNGQGVLSKATRNKILEAAKKMGYEPNSTARTLTTKKSNLIGVIYDDTGMNLGFSHPLFSVILNCFRDKIEAAGYDLVFLSRHYAMSYFSHARYRLVDGVIIINPATNDFNEFADFVKAGLPIVSTNSIINGICTIISDNEKYGYEATEYLIKKGHRKIAFISASLHGISSSSKERYDGFRKALAGHNIPFDENLYIQSEFWAEKGGYQAFCKLWEKTHDFTAVFAVTDQLAFGVYRYAEEHNIKIPDDISVIGFDDDNSAKFLGLTTFRQNGEKIAELAAKMIKKQIEKKEVTPLIRTDAMFIERESVRTIK